MKNTAIISFFGLATLLFLNSCYEPEGINFVEVIPESAGELNGVDFFDEDTVYFRGRDWIDISLPERNALYFELLIDSILVYKREGDPGSYLLDSRDYEDGYHTIQLVVYLPSKSGSLSSLVGSEFTRYTASQVLLVDNAMPEISEFYGFDIVDSTLRLTWAQYRDFDFRTYIIRVGRSEEIFIKDVADTSYLITVYSHGPRDIEFELWAKDTRTTYQLSYEFDPHFKFDLSQKGVIRMEWDSLPFKATSGITVISYDGYDFNEPRYIVNPIPHENFLEVSLDTLPPYYYTGVRINLTQNNDPNANKYFDKIFDENVNWKSLELKGFRTPIYGRSVNQNEYELVYDADTYQYPGSFDIKRFRLDLEEVDNWTRIDSLDEVFLSPDHQIFRINGPELEHIDKDSWDIEKSLDLGSLLNAEKLHQIWPNNNRLIAVSYRRNSGGDDFAIIDLDNSSIYSTVGYPHMKAGWLNQSADKVYFHSQYIHLVNHKYFIADQLVEPFNETVYKGIGGDYITSSSDDSLFFITRNELRITDEDYNLITSVDLSQFTNVNSSHYFDRSEYLYIKENNALHRVNIFTSEVEEILKYSDHGTGGLLVIDNLVFFRNRLVIIE